MAKLHESVGDIFDAAPNSILIHACNAKGVWGTGVALGFKKRYPEAFQMYRDHCLTHTKHTGISSHQASLVGTTLLIPPQPPKARKNAKMKTPIYIACLYTSNGYGKNVDPLEMILSHTQQALEDLAMQIKTLKGDGKEAGECRAVRINSGRFGVPWDRTREILKDGPLNIVVVRPEHEDAGQAVETNQKAEDGSGEEGEAVDGLGDENQEEADEFEMGVGPASSIGKGHRMSLDCGNLSRESGGQARNMKRELEYQPETISEGDGAEGPKKRKQRKKGA